LLGRSPVTRFCEEIKIIFKCNYGENKWRKKILN
jgi:hypothetical protein